MGKAEVLAKIYKLLSKIDENKRVILYPGAGPDLMHVYWATSAWRYIFVDSVKADETLEALKTQIKTEPILKGFSVKEKSTKQVVKQNSVTWLIEDHRTITMPIKYISMKFEDYFKSEDFQKTKYNIIFEKRSFGGGDADIWDTRTKILRRLKEQGDGYWICDSNNLTYATFKKEIKNKTGIAVIGDTKGYTLPVSTGKPVTLWVYDVSSKPVLPDYFEFLAQYCGFALKENTKKYDDDIKGLFD